MDKICRGNAGQFFVAGELSRRGVIAAITLGNCPNTDILCSNPDGTKFAHVQVKTFRPGARTCSVGEKAEKDYGQRFFWVLAGIAPAQGRRHLKLSPACFEYFIIPATDMAANIAESHQQWLDSPGRNGRKHAIESTFRAVRLPPQSCRNDWNVSQYRDAWHLILDVLGIRRESRSHSPRKLCREV
jgi:hypothetical protein